MAEKELKWYGIFVVLLEPFKALPTLSPISLHWRVIHLYAMVVQQESMPIVQMVSLPVSFLSLVWASTSADNYIHSDGNFKMKDKISIFFNALIYFKQSTLCGCFVHRKLQVVGCHYFDLSLFGDSDM